MPDEIRVVTEDDKTREELFLERYHRLFSWAMGITKQHRACAEDLVHDAFIQFTRGRTSVSKIANIDGYLRRMLQYLNLARNSENTERLSSIADYDSFSAGWNTIDTSRRLQAREQLIDICRYACMRKQTSRAGGVLILRFFYDYLPSEIARLLCRTQHCVVEWQRVARIEVKLYLDDPRRLKFVGSAGCCASRHLWPNDDDLISGLRKMIFNSRQGNCISGEQLRQIYECGEAATLTTATFGHIVSCRTCLDSINQMLELPLLEQRFSAEIDERQSEK
jgi:DNA-directed RNA polymerase specialized sigma24 family protein